MSRLNFSWVISNKLAGCAGPRDEADMEFLRRQRITLLVRLTEKHRAKVTSLQVKEAGLRDLHESVADFDSPSQLQMDRIVGEVRAALDEGERVAISCGAGIGRTGTILCCILVSLCYSIEEALELVQTKRRQKRGWESDSQYQSIKEFATRLGKV